jgi:hypothetical protein
LEKYLNDLRFLVYQAGPFRPPAQLVSKRGMGRNDSLLILSDYYITILLDCYDNIYQIMFDLMYTQNKYRDFLSQGMDEREARRKVAELLGHSRIDVTYKYVPKGYEINKA